MECEVSLVERPKTIVAFVLTYALSMGVGLTAMLRATLDAPDSMPQSAGIVAIVLVASLALFIGSKIYRGRNWARVLFSVLAVWGFAMTLTGTIPQTGIPRSFLMDLVQGTLQGACVVLLYLKPSRDWFSHRTAAK